MSRLAEQTPIEAVITTGDNFYEDGVQDTSDEHWDLSFKEVYTGQSLQVPWFGCLGNHDHRGNAEAQCQYSFQDPRWCLPEKHYSVRLPLDNQHIVQLWVIDTTPFVRTYFSGGAEPIHSLDRGSAEIQLAWLNDSLRQSDACWKLVVGHHPVFSGSPFHGNTPELQSQLKPLLEKYGVHAYVCGHEHDLQHLESNGVQYLVSGAAADWRQTGNLNETNFSHSGLGFLLLNLRPEEMSITFLNASGEVIHKATRSSHRAPPECAA